MFEKQAFIGAAENYGYLGMFVFARSLRGSSGANLVLQREARLRKNGVEPFSKRLNSRFAVEPAFANVGFHLRLHFTLCENRAASEFETRRCRQFNFSS